MRKKLFVLMALLIVLSMLAAQCGGKATEEPAPAETEAPMVGALPKPQPSPQH